MVLRKLIADRNTGTTVRKHLFNDAKRYISKKAIISSSRYNFSNSKVNEEHSRDLNNLLSLINIEFEQPNSFWFEILEIYSLLKYFVDKEKELLGGPQTIVPDEVEHDELKEIVRAITTLQTYQNDIDSGELNLGHDYENALRIGVSYRKNSSYGDDTKEYEFRTYKDREKEKTHLETARSAFWKGQWHNAHFRGVQRPCDLRRVKDTGANRIGWQDEITENVFATFYTDIHITITESFVPNYIKWRPQEKNYFIRDNRKSKVASYWQGIGKPELEMEISRIKVAGENRRQRNQQLRARFREQSLLPSDGIYIPIGLHPMDAERQRRRLRKKKQRDEKIAGIADNASVRKGKTKKVQFASEDAGKHTNTNVQQDVLHSAKYTSDQGGIKQDIVKTQHTFLTDIPPEPRDSKHEKTAKKSKQGSSTNAEEKSVVPLWKFTGDLMQNSGHIPSIVFQNCPLHASECVVVNESSTVIKTETASSHTKRKARLNGKRRKKIKQHYLLERQRQATVKIEKDTKPQHISLPQIKVTSLKTEDISALADNLASKESTREHIIKTPRDLRQQLTKFSDLTLEPIDIVVKSSTLRPSSLLKNYGATYVEGHVFPRMFSIDVSESVRDTVKLFRKLDEPFVDPLCILLIEASYIRTEDLSNNNQLALTNIRLHLKADMPTDCLQEFYDRMRAKIHARLIYPLSKIVDYCIQMFQTLSYSSYAGAVLIPSPGNVADERMRSQLDWLLALCQWKFQIHPPGEAFAIFAQAGQHGVMPRPTTSALCRVLRDAQSKLPSVCDTPGCENEPHIRLLSCQHTFCRHCLNFEVLQSIAGRKYPLSCTAPDCGSGMDEVAVLFALSLPQQKFQSVQRLIDLIGAHPLWQWCPRKSCGRAVKLAGTGFLDSTVTVMCDCGHSWCFHCCREGHWPAPCDQTATYLDILKHDSINTKNHDCEINIVTCSGCVAKRTTAQNHDMAKTEREKVQEEEEVVETICRCRLELCDICLDAADTPLAIPAALSKEKRSTVEMGRGVLLPLLLYRCARLQRTYRAQWHWSEAEIRATAILQQIKPTSRRRLISSSSEKIVQTSDVQTNGAPALKSESLLTYSHTPRPPPISRLTTSVLREKTGSLLPRSHMFFSRPITSQGPLGSTKQEAEKFFLVTVQRFVHQCHTLLEFVYVAMLDSSLFRKMGADLYSLVLKLETTMHEINKVLAAEKFNDHIIEDLYRLHTHGEKTLKYLISLFQNTRACGQATTKTSNELTFSKSPFAKLPPIMHSQQLKGVTNVA